MLQMQVYFIGMESTILLDPKRAKNIARILEKIPNIKFKDKKL